MFKSKVNAALMIMHTLIKEDKVTTISELSKAIDRSHSYVEQVMALLRLSNMVKSHRGPGGGYSLTLPARDYTVSMVLEAMGEPDPDTPLFQNIMYDLSATYLMHMETSNQVVGTQAA